jgi:hypothetical protein
MSDRTVRAVITGDSAGAVRAFSEASVAADASSKSIDKSMDNIKTSSDEGMGGLRTAALLISPALAPISDVLEGLGVGLLGIGAAAGAGLGIFALASKDATATRVPTRCLRRGRSPWPPSCPPCSPTP